MPVVPRLRSIHGFTLIEMMVVITIIGIVAAIVVPQFSFADADAKKNAAASITRTVQLKIAEYHAKHGSYPDAIDGNWFANGALPSHPYDTSKPANVVVQNDPRKRFLSQKVSGNLIYWYNSANGMFHLRIPDQGSAAANLALYNEINHCTAESLSQTR